MTVERQDIVTDFYQGNTKKIRDHVVGDDGSPKDLTNAEVTFAVFLDKTEIVYLQKSSKRNDPFGTTEITIDDPSNGDITVHLWPADTHNFYGTYRYHINVIDANGYEETVTTGKLNIFKAFAKRFELDSLPAYLLGGS